MQKSTIFTLTRIAGAAVIAQRFVGFDGAPAGAGEKPLGVAQYDAAAGEALAVDVHGTSVVEAGAPIALGAKGRTPVMSDATGRAVPHDGDAEIAGYALFQATGAGSEVEVLLAL